MKLNLNYAITLTLFFFASTHLSAQNLEVQGKVKVSEMDTVSSADSVVVWLSDGTLAARELSTLHEYQVLSISNDTIYLTNGAMVKLPNDGDKDSTNEKISSIDIQGDSLVVTEGNMSMKASVDSSNTNELQTISRIGLNVTLSDGGGTFQDSVNIYTAGSGIDITNNVISTNLLSPSTIHVPRDVWSFNIPMSETSFIDTTISLTNPSLVVATFMGHGRNESSGYFQYAITTNVESIAGLGVLRLQAWSHNTEWTPLSLYRSWILQPGVHTIQVKAIANHTGAYINGSSLQVSIYPY